jgi:hypothetical protein
MVSVDRPASLIQGRAERICFTMPDNQGCENRRRWVHSEYNIVYRQRTGAPFEQGADNATDDAWQRSDTHVARDAPVLL